MGGVRVRASCEMVRARGNAEIGWDGTGSFVDVTVNCRDSNDLGFEGEGARQVRTCLAAALAEA